MTSETAKVLDQRLKRYRELSEQLNVLEKQISRLDEESKRAAGYSVCVVKFTRFNVVPNSANEVVFEQPLGAPGGGSVINDRELCEFLATKLRMARDLVYKQIKEIPDVV